MAFFLPRASVAIRPGLQLGQVLICALCWMICTLSLFTLPRAMQDITLDWSWSGALAYFVEHRIQFGRDVIYTYGPLGFLQSGANVGNLLAVVFWGRLALVSAISLVLVTAVSRSMTALLLLTASSILFGRLQYDSLVVSAIAASGLLLLSPTLPLWGALAVGLLFSVFALIKFTYLALSALILLVVLCVAPQRWGWFRSIAPLAGFVMGLGVLWVVVLRHDATGFLAWIRGSAEIASGFNETMFSASPGGLLLKGFAALLAVLMLALWQWMAASDRVLGFGRLLIFALTCFVTWKQAFVRGDDGHMVILPYVAMTTACMAFALIAGSTRRAGRAIRVLAAGNLIAVFAICSIALLELGRISPAFAHPFAVNRAAERIRQAVFELADYSGFRQRLLTDLENVRQRHLLPQLSAQIGDASVDVYGDNIGIALLNGWNYRPRPVFQSFSTYTRYLDARNESYVLQRTAPDFYVVELTSIDQRLPLTTDSSTFAAILRNYEPIAFEQGFMLFRKRDFLRQELVQSGPLAFSQPITLDSADRSAKWLRIDLSLSLLGRLRSFFLRPPEVRLVLKTDAGLSFNFRLLPSLAADGLQIDPPLYDLLQLRDYLDGKANERIVSFSLEVADADRPYFTRSTAYSLYRQAMPHGTKSLPLAGILGFGTEPERIIAASTPRLVTIDAQPALFAHAPSELIFNVPHDAIDFRGIFGVMPGAFESVPSLRSLTFSILAIGEEGETLLYEQPLTASMQQAFQVPLSPHKARQLRLQTRCEPNCAGGWSYWARLQFD